MATQAVGKAAENANGKVEPDQGERCLMTPSAIGVAIWLGGLIGAGLWLILEEQRYFAALRQRGAPLASNDELSRRAFQSPHTWPFEAFSQTARMVDLIWKHQPEPEVERLRMRVVRLVCLTGATAVLGVALPGILTLVFGRGRLF
jgi:hypothetical protein